MYLGPLTVAELYSSFNRLHLPWYGSSQTSKTYWLLEHVHVHVVKKNCSLHQTLQLNTQAFSRQTRSTSQSTHGPQFCTRHSDHVSWALPLPLFIPTIMKQSYAYYFLIGLQFASLINVFYEVLHWKISHITDIRKYLLKHTSMYEVLLKSWHARNLFNSHKSHRPCMHSYRRSGNFRVVKFSRFIISCQNIFVDRVTYNFFLQQFFRLDTCKKRSSCSCWSTKSLPCVRGYRLCLSRAAVRVVSFPDCYPARVSLPV